MNASTAWAISKTSSNDISKILERIFSAAQLGDTRIELRNKVDGLCVTQGMQPELEKLGYKVDSFLAQPFLSSGDTTQYEALKIDWDNAKD